jgi:hypothetical protein
MSQKISQFTQIVTLASGDYFPVVQTSGTTNKAVQVGALDQRYFVVASGNKAQSTADSALSSGNAALVSATSAQASGNAALVSAASAQASGNAALVLGATAALKLPLSGGVVSGQFAQNIVPIGLYGSGINTALGNYFTATLSGNSTVVISGAPSGVAYSFAYEVNHQTGTITWPAAVSWPSATAPTLTTGKTHIFMFVTDDSGTNWRASSLINYTT